MNTLTNCKVNANVSNKQSSEPQQVEFNGYDFFSGLSRAEKEALFSMGTRQQYDKDELIFSAGSSCDDLFVMLSGRAKVFELSKEGKEVILWFCFPGELFGLAEVMSHRMSGPRRVNAEACSNVELLAVNRQEFTEYLHQYPEVALRVIDLLSFRMRELGDMILNLVSDDVSVRVMKLLVRLAQRYGKSSGNNMYLDIMLTHQEMADMIGTSRQTVTLVLGNLKREGVLEIKRRTIHIRDFSWIKSKLVTNVKVSRKDDINLHVI